LSRVLMLVINPMVNDSRVDKEAASLAAAGHEVIVVATAQPGLPPEEQRDGFTILRRPYRRVLKDLVLSPSRRLTARQPAVREQQRALRHIGARLAARLLVIRQAAMSVVSRLWLLTGGIILKLVRSRILPLEYWLGICRTLPSLVPRPDVIHVHDLGPLAAGARLARRWTTKDGRPPVVYDSHELYTEQQTRWTPREKLLWRVHERRWIRHADAVITVSGGIAQELQLRYRLANRPTVILNSPSLVTALATDGGAPDVRTDAGVVEARLAVYVGAVKPGRGVDRLVPALSAIPGWHLAIVGGGHGEHVQRLVAAAQACGVNRRLHVLPAVPAATLSSYLRSADVGVHPMERTCLNHELALPNKLFDYLLAGLPVAVSDLREMRTLVTREQLGTVFDPSDAPGTGRAILAAASSRSTARDRGELLQQLSWEAQTETLLRLYDQLA
jgi:glycosyltransferase involved in cell wall biosynthesis